MSDIFEIIYRTSQTDGSPGTTAPAPSDVTWGDVRSKPFSSLGDSLNSAGGTLNTVGVTDSFELATGETLVVERGLIVDVIPPES